MLFLNTYYYKEGKRERKSLSEDWQMVPEYGVHSLAAGLKLT